MIRHAPNARTHRQAFSWHSHQQFCNSNSALWFAVWRQRSFGSSNPISIQQFNNAEAEPRSAVHLCSKLLGLVSRRHCHSLLSLEQALPVVILLQTLASALAESEHPVCSVTGLGRLSIKSQNAGCSGQCCELDDVLSDDVQAPHCLTIPLRDRHRLRGFKMFFTART